MAYGPRCIVAIEFDSCSSLTIEFYVQSELDFGISVPKSILSPLSLHRYDLIALHAAAENRAGLRCIMQP